MVQSYIIFSEPGNTSSNATAAWETSLFISSGVFAFLALFISLFLIYRHLKHWTDPAHQIYIVRILIMVPVYAVDSWLSIRFIHYSLYFNIARDCYEAYVLYQFFALLVAYFESNACDEGETIDAKLSTYEPQKFIAPLWCFPKFYVGPVFMLHMRRSVLQYVILKPLIAIITVILDVTDHFHEGSFRPEYGYLWITLILNISVCYAMYCLILFYTVIQESIKEFHPVLKLMAIKAIIAAAFWQSVIIAGLGFFDVIPEFGPDWPKEHVASAINNAAICFEMFLLAIAHIWIFGYVEYRPNERKGESLLAKSKNVLTRLTTDVVNQKDMVVETRDAFSPKQWNDAQNKNKVYRSKRAERKGASGLDGDATTIEEDSFDSLESEGMSNVSIDASIAVDSDYEGELSDRQKSTVHSKYEKL